MKELILTQDKVALLDDEDYITQNQYLWCYKNGYAVRKINAGRNKQKQLYLHREIMNTPDHLDCDHRDGNGLNCQRYNLRNCTTVNNCRNRNKIKIGSSKYKGVCWYIPARGIPKWRASIRVNKILLNLGNYTLEYEAAIAYNIAAEYYFKEFANLNIIEEEVEECVYTTIAMRLSGKLNEMSMS